MMARNYVYGTVRDSRRNAIYAIRVQDDIIDAVEAEQIADLMREKLQSRGEMAADVVVVQGHAKETLRLYGVPYSVSRVRAAMFNAALSWQPIELD